LLRWDPYLAVGIVGLPYALGVKDYLYII